MNKHVKKDKQKETKQKKKRRDLLFVLNRSCTENSQVVKTNSSFERSINQLIARSIILLAYRHNGSTAENHSVCSS